MSFLQQVDLPEGFGPFAAFRETFGFVPEIFRAQSLLPRVIEAEAELANSILFLETELSVTQKEGVLLAVALANRNSYCAAAHYERLRILGLSEQRLDGMMAASNGSTETALLDFAIRLSKRPATFGKAQIEQLRGLGFSDVQILEVILATALAAFLCTVATGLGVTPEFAPPPFQEWPEGAPVPAAENGGPYLSSITRSALDFAPFAFFRESFGFVPNVFKAQTLRPEVVEAEAYAVRKILLTEDVLTRFQKECILLVVSAVNLNTYCVAVHCEMLRNLGVSEALCDQIASDHHLAGLLPADEQMLDAALKLARQPGEFRAGDVEVLREAGFREEQILEAIVMTSLTTFLNTLQRGLGVVPDFKPRLVFPLKEVNLSHDFERPRLQTLDPEESKSEPDPDLAVIARVRGGETDAFEELVRRHGQKIYRSLMGMLGNGDEAEDALQDVFLKAFEHLEEFEGRSRFSTWLVRIAINTGIQRLRGRRDIESLESDDEEFRPRNIQIWQDDPEQSYSKEEMRSLIEREILKLPVKYRLVLILRDLEELSSLEAAGVLGLSVPALKARLIRGRLMLREALVGYFARTGTGANA